MTDVRAFINSLLALPAPLLFGAAALVVLFLLLLLRRQRESLGRAEFEMLMRQQAEMQGRLASLGETLSARQQELGTTLSDRLDGMSQRIGATLTDQTRATHDNLLRLQQRLTAIDAAQANIQTLARDVVGLQAILSNKQTRGAFGQSRMETIVADQLPIGAYRFQATLSNGTRPDCLIDWPKGPPRVLIDANFPLVACIARRAETGDARTAAGKLFLRDMDVHLKDIAGKYLLPGETQDLAFLFVPSESIFADIHEHFEAIVQRAQKLRIVIVSPSLLMLSIQVIQSVLKDYRMREQAHLIQTEVAHLMEDLARLDERVRKLGSHFTLAQKDVETILASSTRLTRRGEKIASLDLSNPATAAATVASPDPAVPREIHLSKPRTGILKFRVVDED